MLVNSGTFRRTEFRIEKYIGGQPVFSGGFPLLVSLLNPFAEYTSITEEELSLMEQSVYVVRLNAFYTYLALQYPFFNPSEHIPTRTDEISHGTDLNACPLDFSPEFTPTLRLSVQYFVLGSDLEAIVLVESVDSSGNLVNVGNDVLVSYQLKQAIPGSAGLWDAVSGSLITSTLPTGQNQLVLVPRFRYRGADTDTVAFKSVFVQLFSGEISGEYLAVDPTKVSLSMNDPAFLTNFVSNIQSSVQGILSQAQAQEIVDAKLGEITSGKSTYGFSFQANVPQRPVFIYPAIWGKLEAIRYLEGFNADILEAGAFQLTGVNPYQFTLNVNGASINCFVYSASNLIIYPKKANYQFVFSGA